MLTISAAVDYRYLPLSTTIYKDHWLYPGPGIPLVPPGVPKLIPNIKWSKCHSFLLFFFDAGRRLPLQRRIDMAANDLVQDASLPVASSIMASDNHDPEKSAMVSGGISGATNVCSRKPPMSVPVEQNKGGYSSSNGSFFYGTSNSLPLSPDTGRRDRPSTNGRFQPYERKPLSRKSSQKDEEMFSSSPEKANENGPHFLKVCSASPTSKLVLGSPDGPSVRKKHSPGKENMSACVHNFPSQSSSYASRFHKSRFEVPPEIKEQQMMSGSTKQKLLCKGATIDGKFMRVS